MSCLSRGTCLAMSILSLWRQERSFKAAVLELSADAPIREPYIAYMQGGLTYAHAKYGVLTALFRLVESGLIVIKPYIT